MRARATLSKPDRKASFITDLRSLKRILPTPLRHSLWRLRRRLIIDYGIGNKSAVFLAGSGRSGTTWVAGLINYRGEYRYITEPFNPEHSAFCHAFNYALYLRPDNDSAQYLVPARRLITGRAGFNRRTHQYNRRYITSKRLIKEVRAHLWLKWLQTHFPGMPIILLLRHPCAVTLSRIRRNLPNFFEDLFTQTELFADFLEPFRPYLERARTASEWEQRIFSWCIQQYVPLKQFRREEIHVAFYEHFAENPREELARMFAYLRKPFDERVLEIVRRPSPVTRTGAAILTGESLVARWKSEIPKADIERAVEILSLFGLDAIYSGEPLPNIQAAYGFLQP